MTNKIDLLRDVPGNTDSHVYISAKTGEGIEKLKTMIFDAVGFRNSVQGVFIARRRHIESLQKTKESLEKVREYLSQDQFFLDMVAEELRLAGVSMGRFLVNLLPISYSEKFSALSASGNSSPYRCNVSRETKDRVSVLISECFTWNKTI